jgi:hypothetical protein
VSAYQRRAQAALRLPPLRLWCGCRDRDPDEHRRCPNRAPEVLRDTEDSRPTPPIARPAPDLSREYARVARIGCQMTHAELVAFRQTEAVRCAWPLAS